MSSANTLEKVAGDFHGRYSSSSIPVNELCNQKNQMHDCEIIDNHVNTTEFGSPLSSEPNTSVQLVSLPASIQNPCISETAGNSELFTERISHLSRADQRTSIQNGSGQKLESIIGRLSSDRVVAALVENDQDTLICKADASTQTFPDFVKVIDIG